MRRSEATNGDIERTREPSSSGARLNENRVRLREATMPGDARMTTVCVAATPLAGGQVRVRLLLATPLRRHHVALVDPLPGGLEPLNPVLAVTATPDGLASVDEWGRRSAVPWFEHQNLRDDRAEAFASVMQTGVYEYSYLARATTLGHFAAPPPKVEEMYHPETFGRGTSDRVVVE